MSMRKSFSAPFVPPAPITSISHGGGQVTNLRGLNIFTKAQANQFIQTGVTPADIQRSRDAQKAAEAQAIQKEQSFFSGIQDQIKKFETQTNEQLQSFIQSTTPKAPEPPAQTMIGEAIPSPTGKKFNLNSLFIPGLIITVVLLLGGSKRGKKN